MDWGCLLAQPSTCFSGSLDFSSPYLLYTTYSLGSSYVSRGECYPLWCIAPAALERWQSLGSSGHCSWLPSNCFTAAQDTFLCLHIAVPSIVYYFLCIRSPRPVMALILHDRTNSDRTSSDSPTIPPCDKTLRRVQSSRLSRFNLDSDDSIPSEHSSIYDAASVLRNENADHGDDVMSPLDLQKRSPSLPLSPSLENLDQLADLPSVNTIQVQESLPASHSNWPITQLETIVERRSISTLHASISLPRLNPSATRYSSIDEELHSHDSTSQTPSYWPPNWSTNNGPLSRRSFSENDAFCLRLPRSKVLTKPYKEDHSSSSSSSDELFGTGCLATWPSFPLKPPRPPPERSPTPPGLPSFGSPEAIQLMTLPGVRGASARNNQERPSRRNRRPASGREGIPPPVTPVLRPVDKPRSPKGKSVIKRIIRSCSRSSSDERQEDTARRVSLPSGFVARADDGTYVRGRFGARSSGHGVGAMTGQQSVGLGAHPFHRSDPAGRTLDDGVREIDKAHVDNERTPSQRAERTRQQRAPNNVQSSRLPRSPNSALSSRLQRSTVVPETGGPSRSWGFWQSCHSSPVDTPDIFSPPEAPLPTAIRPRVTIDVQAAMAQRTCESRTLISRRLSAESKILAARLEEERERGRKRTSGYWEKNCWNSMYEWCCGERSTSKEVTAVISRESGGVGLSRSPNVLVSEEPPVNARMVYPTLLSEEEAVN